MDGMMHYNGYRARIYFDDDDNIFVGEVFGIQDSLNFHGESVRELTEMFHQCIDNYLEMCKRTGKTPNKEYKGSFNIRIGEQKHRAAAEEAFREGISLNEFVEHAISEKLAAAIETY